MNSGMEGSIKARTTQDPNTLNRLRTNSRKNSVTGCLVWTGPMHSREPYGYAHFDGRPQLVHRVAYEAWVGPIPDGHVIDHLCENTRCIEPTHLEAVQSGVNVLRGNGWGAKNARKTHCPHGHEYTPENTRVAPLSLGRTGKVRFCKACAQIRSVTDSRERTAHICSECGWYGRRKPKPEQLPCPTCGGVVAEYKPKGKSA